MDKRLLIKGLPQCVVKSDFTLMQCLNEDIRGLAFYKIVLCSMGKVWSDAKCCFKCLI